MYDVRKCNGPKNCFGTDTVWKSSLDCKSDNVFENAVRINGSVCVSVICVLYTCHCVRCTYLLLSHRYRCTAHNSNRRHYSLHRTSNYKKKTHTQNFQFKTIRASYFFRSFINDATCKKTRFILWTNKLTEHFIFVSCVVSIEVFSMTPIQQMQLNASLFNWIMLFVFLMFVMDWPVTTLVPANFLIQFDDLIQLEKHHKQTTTEMKRKEKI